MKRFFSILAVVAFTFALTSCGSDDNETPTPIRPKGMPEEINDVVKSTFTILTNGSIENEQTIKLSDFKKIKKEYLPFVTKAETNSTNSYIEISGVTAKKYQIENLTLKVKGTDISKKFGDVKEDKKYNTIADLTFIEKIAKRIEQKKEVVLKLTGKPNKTINEDVKVIINLDTKFILKQFRVVSHKVCNRIQVLYLNSVCKYI